MSLPWIKHRRAEDAGQQGQTLVEFALVIPLLMIMFMAVIEVALALNAVVGVNRASQQAAHLASILGDRAGADCMILRDIEEDVIVPNDRNKIQEVRVQRTALVGNQTFSYQRYTRNAGGPPLECTLPNGDEIELPYQLSANVNPALGPYEETERCSILIGCPPEGSQPQRSTVDNVGVEIRYRHLWATPLPAMFENVFGGGDVGWNITQRNIFRMEPTL